MEESDLPVLPSFTHDMVRFLLHLFFQSGFDHPYLANGYRSNTVHHCESIWCSVIMDL